MHADATATTTTAARGVLRRVAIVALAAGAVGLAVACVLPWVPVWPCVLFEHFRVQYVACGAIVVAGAVALRMRGWLDVAAIATLLHALPVVADLCARPSRDNPEGVVVRVLVVNVHTSSSSFDDVRALIEAERPDVVGLVEVDRRWLDALAPALASYEGRIEHPRDDNFGVALYARGRIDGAAELLGSRLPTIAAEVGLKHTRFHVVLTHPIPPVSASALADQEAQLAAIAARAAGLERVVVMGDLNATPWSRPFRQLTQRARLCDTRSGFGLQPTFPTSSWLLRIPIDHVLVSCSIGVSDRRIGPDVGSDHLPVIVELSLPHLPRSS